VKRRRKLARLGLGEWLKKMESPPSQSPRGRNCPCGGSNENCSLCNGLGVITSTSYRAPLGMPRSDLRVCEKCDFRGSTADLTAHRLQQHSTQLRRCIRCRFEGTAAELEAHWAVAHRGSFSDGHKPVKVYVCDSCGFRSPLLLMEQHIRTHDVERTVASCLHVDEELRSVLCPVCGSRIKRTQIVGHFERWHRAYSRGVASSLGLGFHDASDRNRK
jgi:predicted RNA-binding Zn-ribbon protein involved in translation (DUF1610 family)